MDAPLARLLDENLLDATREFARWQTGGVTLEGDGLLLVAGTTAFPVGYANCVLRTDPTVPAGDVLARARAFFGPRRRGFTVFARGAYDRDLEDVLGRAGVPSLVDTPCMVIDHPLESPRLGPGCELRPVVTDADAVAVREINAEAYGSLGLPADETRALYGSPSRLLAPHYVTTLGFHRGIPTSTAMVIFSPLVAGVYWVGTRSIARRTGLAEACTRQVTNAAFVEGARAVTLQASPMGEPIYARLGYRTFDRLRWYVVPV